MINESSFTKYLWKNYSRKHKYTEIIKFEKIKEKILTLTKDNDNYEKLFSIIESCHIHNKKENILK